MEYLNHSIPPRPVKAVLFDFDGTISTLRCNWEAVMKPLMVEYILTDEKDRARVEAEVDAYIDESTGIQTIHQMKWLAAHAAKGHPTDPWWYKDEYNRRLMEVIRKRRRTLEAGAPREDYLIAGSEAFLKALKARGVRLYVASGTDDPDVKAEATALGVDRYFTEIKGAPVRAENCSKEAVLRDLIATHGLKGDEVAVIGDGKVEIALGKANGARTLGLATNEVSRHGVNPVKRERLVRAGADAIEGDFTDMEALNRFLGLD